MVMIPLPQIEEREAENILRPQRLSEFPGQAMTKQRLTISIEAAKRTGESVPHMMFYGPPGLGKTTLAMIMANEIGAGFHVTSAPAIRRSEELVSLMTEGGDRDVVFIDEIHRLSLPIEEALYSAMEDGVVDVIFGKGMAAKPVRFTIPKITVIGATTRLGSISEPMRDRFGAIHRLEPYDIPTLAEIMVMNSKKLGMEFGVEVATEIARRSRGTPRIANRLLAAAREYAIVFRDGVIDDACLAGVWKLLELDDNGMDLHERRLLKALAMQPAPVGVNTLATLVDESTATIEDVMEPHLLQLGLMARTPRGRVITDAGKRYIA